MKIIAPTIVRVITVLTMTAFVMSPQMAYAAISFVGSAENAAANNADPTADLTTISGLAENDLVIAACGLGDEDAANGNVTMNTAGYTGLSDLFQDAANETNFEVFYKFMSSSVDASAICEGSTLGNDTATAIVVMAFRGVDTTTPFDVASTSITGASDPDADPPSIDWSTAGVWTVIAVASAHDLAGDCTADAYVFPTGYTTNQIECRSADTTDISVGMGYNSAPADPENPGIVDHNGTDSTNDSWAAVTMALLPQSTVAPTISTDAASGANSFSAVLNGQITATGGENSTVRGFAWGTSATLSNGDTSTTTDTTGAPFGVSSFTQRVSGLIAGRTYYFRAYATNSAGTGFDASSPILSFTASAADTTVSRKMRLFEGYAIKFISGRIILHQK